jgi:hypothetical protein
MAVRCRKMSGLAEDRNLDRIQHMRLARGFTLESQDEIPKAKGIYAFYLDFSYLQRTLGSVKEEDLNHTLLFEKCARAHTMSRPKPANISLHRRESHFHNRLSVKLTHDVGVNTKVPGARPSEVRAAANVLAYCTFLTSPLYIGITLEQDFRRRFQQHYRTYRKAMEAMVGSGTTLDLRYDPTAGGKFGEKLARRGLEFRDLIFACVSLTHEELKSTRLIEHLLHVVVNPSLSQT